MIFRPYDYQDFSIKHILDNPYAGLFQEMGLGKTVISLSAMDDLSFNSMEIERWLVIAPKRVAEDTWVNEVAKWDHLKHLRISLVLGSEKERKQALKDKADIYVINRENVVWLVAFYGGAWPFDGVVIDELSSFKDPKAQRFKALRQVRPQMKRVIGLTGTPAPNGLLDLWPQLYLLDQGERLGKTITSYRSTYFNEGMRNGHVVYKYNLKPDEADFIDGNKYEREIYSKISDICISMKAKDYLDLPPMIETVSEITLPAKIMAQYLDFEKKMVLQLDDGDDISAVNAAALCGKLCQFANGAVYDADKNYHEVHNCKIERLIENLEAASGPVLVWYWFKHDLERLQKYLKSFKGVKLNGAAEITAWNKGNLPLMYAHPASAGHGLNLQYGGSLMEEFSQYYSLELSLQAAKRLHRPGITKPVLNNRLIAKGTIDEDIVQIKQGKNDGQERLLNAVKAIIQKYKN